MQYLAPRTIEDAVELRVKTGFPFLAGGTDLYPAIEHGLRPEGFIDISGVPQLRGEIRRSGDSWLIPALATWTEVVRAGLPPQFDGVREAAAEVGGRQIQNMGTVGGNICNASPAADGTAALLALDAAVLIEGAGGARELPLSAFVRGNRRTALAADELVRAIRVPARDSRQASVFKKLGARRYLVISIVMVSAAVEIDARGRIQRAAISVGGCSDRPLRITAAERRLCGAHIGEIGGFTVSDGELEVLSPIDDIRASAAFRRAAAKALVTDAVGDVTRRLTS